MRVTAIVPTLNEEKSIARVVRGCLDHADEALVIDGGSTDRTRAAAHEAGARVVSLERRGKGLATRHAIATADSEILVFIDADGSHCPKDIPALTEPIARGDADLVIGSRATGGSDELDRDHGHLLRALGSRAILMLVNAVFGTRLTDMQNGFRAVRTDVARDLGLREDGFCIEQEMVIRCLSKGYRVTNTPSHEYRRLYGKSRLRLWPFAPKCAWNLISLLTHSLFTRGTRTPVPPPEVTRL
ncbi:MAG: glycosyltransferase family 2 protein [Armatimonadota bacterium]|nr:glycosyltransferase family 2 protein [Armatimonadota bacterium]